MRHVIAAILFSVALTSALPSQAQEKPHPIAVQVKTAAGLIDVSPDTIRQAVNKGTLPAFRVGRTIRIFTADLEEWCRNQTVVGSEDDRAEQGRPV